MLAINDKRSMCSDTKVPSMPMSIPPHSAQMGG
jgi:hypothetical protein